MHLEKCYQLFERLQQHNPRPVSELHYSSHFELLIAVMLSAQATDVGVNKVTAHLFTLANTPHKMLSLGEATLSTAINSINLYKTKAKHIIKTCQQLIDQHQGKVPNDRKSLEALPGVGRKTANVILNVAFKQPTIAVDTHLFRVSNRTGLAKGKTPLAVEQGLLRKTPQPFLLDAHHWLILLGRYCCTARKPKCPECVIQDLCEYPHKTTIDSPPMIKQANQHGLFARAKQAMPGGVNSPVRAFKAVGGMPTYFKQGKGAWLTDTEGKRYIDYVGSWGPAVLGHAHPAVVKAIQQAASLGLGFGATHASEIELAEQIIQAIPSIERLRCVNSGTEAAMTAVRLARAYTQRNVIIKFKGGYHGHVDSLLVEAGSGLATLDIQTSPGIPGAFAQYTLNATFNDLSSVNTLMEQHQNQIAAVIVEPIAGNMGCVLPIKGFLAGLRRLCNQHKALLIFDEVMTGFRVAFGGAQSCFNIKPDLTLLGKIIGGGLPVGAVGGKQAIMDHLAPLGAVYQAGTLSGNPMAMTAGIHTLNTLNQPGIYKQLQDCTQQLAEGLKAAADTLDVPLTVNYTTGMLSVFFTENKTVHHYTAVESCNQLAFKHFFQSLLSQGIYWPPSPFESAFVSLAHNESIIQKTLRCAKKALDAVRKSKVN